MSRSLGRPSFFFMAMVAALFAAATLAFDIGHAQTPVNGRVRVLHASADTPPVDIFVNGQKAVGALAFTRDTGYVSLPAGTYDVKVFVSPSDGTGNAALQASLPIAGGKDYTVLAVGEASKNTLALLPLEDNSAAPNTGQAHVRLIHASPDAPAVDIVVAGTSTKVFSNVAYKAVGTYTPVPAGTYNLDVKVASNSQTVKTIAGLALSDRTVYTVVATGPAAGLQVLPLVDAKPAIAAPAAPAAGNGPSLESDRSARTAMLGAGLVGLAASAVAGTVAVRARSRAS